MIINYCLRGEITEDQSTAICDFINKTIGGGFIPEPYEDNGCKIITFPASNKYKKPMSPETMKEKTPEPPEKKNTPIIIEALPGETLPEGFTDYRPLLQRDGLILYKWEILKDRAIKIVWIASNANRGMFKYQAITYSENELKTICPYEKYSPCDKDFVIYAAPETLSPSIKKVFISTLQKSGVSVDFNYEFSLGKQNAEKERAIFDKINECKTW